MTQRKRAAQRAIEKFERVKAEQASELDGIMADAARNSPRVIGFEPAKIKPEFQAEVDQMVAIAEARKALSDAQQVAVPADAGKVIVRCSIQEDQGAGELESKWDRMAESQKTEWEGIAQAAISLQQVSVPDAVLDAISRAGFMLVKAQSGYSLLPAGRIEAQGAKK